jgi:hypothetical protein
MIFWSFSHITKFGSPWGFLTLSTSRLAARSSSAACRPRDAGVQPRLSLSAKTTLGAILACARRSDPGRQRHTAFCVSIRVHLSRPLYASRLFAEARVPAKAARFLRFAPCSIAPFGCRGIL